MRWYYFDIREGDEIFSDEEGLELSTVEKVQEEAARSLADMARDAVRTPPPNVPGKTCVKFIDS